MTTIQPVPRGSRAALLPLLEAYAAEMRRLLAGSAPASGTEIAALLDAHPAAEVLMVEEGAPLGFAVFYDLPEAVFAQRCGQLDDLFILPEARRRGLARALLEALLAEGRARGWSHLRWFVPAGDAAAIALYERLAERADWRSYLVRLDPSASL
jgi:ribosomal protein S18 acetylase RimI-like enzyme